MSQAVCTKNNLRGVKLVNDHPSRGWPSLLGIVFATRAHVRQLSGAFGLAAGSVLLSATAFAQGGAGAPPALPVSVIEATPTTLPNILEITAQAEGAKETEVRSRGRWYFGQTPVRRGQPSHRGSALVSA